MYTSIQPSLACVLMETLRTFKRDLCDTYRPELHYMRGPGPKWRERRGLRLAPVALRQRSARISHLRTED
jgi:hypothetical protein